MMSGARSCLGMVHMQVAPNGTLRWKLRVDSEVQSSPAIGAGGTVFFTSFKSSL